MRQLFQSDGKLVVIWKKTRKEDGIVMKNAAASRVKQVGFVSGAADGLGNGECGGDKGDGVGGGRSHAEGSSGGDGGGGDGGGWYNGSGGVRYVTTVYLNFDYLRF